MAGRLAISLRRLGGAVMLAFLAAVILEALLALPLRYPGLLPHLPMLVIRALRHPYLQTRRDPQANPALVRYDQETTYVFRPGAHRFANTEFDTSLVINRAGLRDDDASLDAPQVVVLGDSFAMGWGVEAEDTFAQRLEARTGLRVLNAAITSYGTARSLRLLRRLDTRRLQALIVQYCANDHGENRAFLASGGRLPITPETGWRAALAAAEPARRPGHLQQLLFAAAASRASALLGTDSPPAAPTLAEEAEAFVAVLAATPVDLSGVAVVAFEVDSYGRQGRRDFTGAVRTVLHARPGALAAARVILLDTRGLTPQLFFRLDDHLRPEGHEWIARELIRALKEQGVVGGESP